MWCHYAGRIPPEVVLRTIELATLLLRQLPNVTEMDIDQDETVCVVVCADMHTAEQ